MLRHLLLLWLVVIFAVPQAGCEPRDVAEEAPAAPGTSGGDPSPAASDESGTPGAAAGSADGGGGALDIYPDPVRTVFLGTSLTAGFGLLRRGERYTERLQTMADSAGIPVEVVNAGVSGDTSAGGVRRLDWVLEEPLDVLVVELGANDGLRGQPPAALEENLRTIVRRTRDRYPAARIALVRMEAPSNLGDRYTESFREVFSRVARDMDVTLLPFLLEDVAGVPSLNQEDGIHPNAEGHEVAARTLWPGLEPLLRGEAREAAEAAEAAESAESAGDA